MFDPRFRTALLEDREPVVMLTGFKKNAEIPSNQPHAGMWGPQTAYALIPCNSPNTASRRATILQAFDPSLSVQETDAEVLAKGSVDAITTLLKSGPEFARARIRRAPNTGNTSHLDAFKFTPRRSVDPPTPQKAVESET